MKLRRGLQAAGVLVAILLALEVLAGVESANNALHPGRKPLAADALTRLNQMTSKTDASWRAVSVKAADGAELRAWVVQPKKANGDAVILLHGHGDNRLGMMSRAELLLRHGYAVLLPDARAHGESGGELATYGVLEAADVRLWFDWLQADLHPHCVDGYGASMGAAAVFESLATTPGYCAVVADSPFASFREISYDRVGQQIGQGDGFGRTVGRPVVEIGFLVARWKFGQDFRQASPLKAAVESHVPVLLIHGDQDSNVPIRHSYQILAAAKGREPQIAFWSVPGAEHTLAMKVDPAGFEQRVVGWFETHRR